MSSMRQNFFNVQEQPTLKRKEETGILVFSTCKIDESRQIIR